VVAVLPAVAVVVDIAAQAVAVAVQQAAAVRCSRQRFRIGYRPLRLLLGFRNLDNT